MDDAVLGLVWVTSVCIVGHIASAFYFQRILRNEAYQIDNKIQDIDMGIASVAQWMIDKFDNPANQTVGIDWGQIIGQLFQQNSPNNIDMIPNDTESYGAQEWTQDEEGSTQEKYIS
tara:strand:+ start:148 stop:498 length:351 start_codon:yes stop_codon:yes gene_type:complete